ncbi:hypothetical protein SynMITS9220_02433 [Synechococcus sp. MIT S9220]|nr:hypothetical protein SynMITS9220_02433 [Synechococcus sp. MIT S9220]
MAAILQSMKLTRQFSNLWNLGASEAWNLAVEPENSALGMPC